MGRQGADGKNTAILRFFRGLCRETAEFGSFIKRNRAGALFSGAAALFVYWGWLTSADITVDSEIMMTDPQSMMASWLGINRFGLVFYQASVRNDFLCSLCVQGAYRVYAVDNGHVFFLLCV